VYSFNPTKIIGKGGGALTIKDKTLLKEVLEVFNNLPVLPVNNETRQILALSYRNLHHSLVALDRIQQAPLISDLFLKLRRPYEPLYIQNISSDSITALANEWKDLKNNNAARCEKACQYEKKLSKSPHFTPVTGWKESGVCWRATFLFSNPDGLIPLSEQVRKEGFHVSNLYWPVNFFFHPDDICENAYFFARRVINLWVDRTVDPDWVNRCAESVLTNSANYL
jgi:dTDP-4-amino-4,6-dideoxygalactose transaminase